MKKVELMSPAGDIVSLKAALQAGADAVYFGISAYNMRASAKNFALDDIFEVTALCHSECKKAYLTLNSIAFDKDIKLLDEIIKQAALAKVDAIICWDFAIIESTLRHAVEPFISTQMSVSNASSILSLYLRYGIKRFVLARECTLEDIAEIRNNLESYLGIESQSIELEVFAHGAMCVAISGRCFMSAFQFGDSANLGACKQPCRREYLITDVRDGKSFVLGQNYLMSPKDLCIIPFIEKVIQSGVRSLKIEGRGRSPEYVFEVTSCYRDLIDSYYKLKDKPTFSDQFAKQKEVAMQRLKKVFNRGFSDGFYFGKPLNAWTEGNGSKATHRKVYIGQVTNFFKKVMVAEIKVEACEFSAKDELMFQGATTGVLTLKADSIESNFKPVEKAEKNTLVGVKLNQIVREGDKVYKHVSVEELNQLTSKT